MTIKYVVAIGIMVSILSTANMSVYASVDEDEFKIGNQNQRSSINPEFDPDFDCIYDVSQIHCIPGSAQECPKPQFSAGDPEMCFPKTLVNGEWKWVCPEGYHNEDNDETGQCYPNEEGCINDEDFVLLTDRADKSKSDRCADLDYICNENEYVRQDYCMEYCNSNPERQVCNIRDN